MVQTWEGGPCKLTRAQSYKEGTPGKAETQRRERSGRQKKGTQLRMFPVNTGLCRTEQQVSFLGGREGKLEVPSPGLRSCSPNSLVVPRSHPPAFLLIRPFCPPPCHMSLGFSLLPRPSAPQVTSLFLAFCLSLDPRHTHLQPQFWTQCAALSGL